MAEITWTAEAQRWLEDIFEYIAADNPHAAAQTVTGISFEGTQLCNGPAGLSLKTYCFAYGSPTKTEKTICDLYSHRRSRFADAAPDLRSVTR